MARTNVLPADAPAWVTKDRQINELIYSCSFLSAHPMKCIHGRFFTVDGLVPDEGSLKQIIFDDISEWKESGVARKVDDLLKTIKLMAYSEDIPLHYDRIHVANDTWYLDGRFTGDKEYCRNRLTVDYNPDADMPGVWLKFLSELLIPEDIYKCSKMYVRVGLESFSNLSPHLTIANSYDNPQIVLFFL